MPKVAWSARHRTIPSLCPVSKASVLPAASMETLEIQTSGNQPPTRPATGVQHGGGDCGSRGPEMVLLG